VLAFKLFGLWFLAQAAIGTANLPYVWQTGPAELRGATVAFLFLPSLVALGIGIPVWFSAEWFASRVFRDPKDATRTAVRVNAEPMLALGASLLGLYFVGEGVPSVSSSLYLFGRSFQGGVLGPDPAQERLLWDASAKAAALGGVIRLLVGLALLAGPTRWAAGVARVQKEFGTSLLEETDDRPKE
jgi:hypothetical protein